VRYDPESRHRRSVRLKGYDYACAGACFVTICTQDRACLFGEIENGKMLLNDAGRMVQSVWNELPVYYAGIETDAFIIMPNHIHGIIVITDPSTTSAAAVVVGAGPCACPDSGPRVCPDSGPRACPDYDGHVDYPNDLQRITGQPITGQQEGGQPQGVAPTGGVVPVKNGGVQTGLSLPDAVHRFKSMTTHQYIHGVKQSGWPPFRSRLWQRNYWEHIVRNAQDLARLREYIRFNPETWALDALMVAH